MHRRLGSLAAAFCVVAVLAPQRLVAATFPPRANAAWVYDPLFHHDENGRVIAGYFASEIAKYNEQASPGARIGELYVYGGDMEMYCPDHRAARCVPSDFHVYFSNAARHAQKTDARSQARINNASVHAYARRFASKTGGEKKPLLRIAATIDGVTSKRGALRGFDKLSRRQAAIFAAKVAKQICADESVDGVEFDLEPLNVSKRAGQFYFYTSIARDFASTRRGCVDRDHPHGRFFSLFTVANRIRPHTSSARHIEEILHTSDNGYLIDALYDLSSTPPGHQTPVAYYHRLVQREVRHMKQWASRIDVKYQFGIPAAASAHEFDTCHGPRCHRDQDLSRKKMGHQNTQLEYVKAALVAMRDNHIMTNPNFLGISLWAWSPGLRYKNMRFSPHEPPVSVEKYLSEALSRARHPSR